MESFVQIPIDKLKLRRSTSTCWHASMWHTEKADPWNVNSKLGCLRDFSTNVVPKALKESSISTLYPADLQGYCSVHVMFCFFAVATNETLETRGSCFD